MNFKEDWLKLLENISFIVNAPVVNIIVIAGISFIFLSFFSINIISNKIYFHLFTTPKLYLFITGIALVLFSLLVLYFSNGFIIKKVNIRKGLTLKLKDIIINIKVGEIQEISGIDKSFGIVLPANTSFVDDCITDTKSALGAFMVTHFPDKLGVVGTDIMEQLNSSGYQRNANNTYSPGTTIILPEPYKSLANIIITAATIRRSGVGITSNPAMLSECIKGIFEITADKKISTIQIPVIGSGHGGLEINFALVSLIFSIWFFSKHFHHLKQFNIIVREEDQQRLKYLSRYICLTKLD